MSGTTPGTTPRVRLGTLVRDESLGKGGQGEVWAVKERKINNEWPIAYKQYEPPFRATADFAALQAMVDLIPSLDPPVGRWLCERSAWPAAVVEDDRGPCGFLMRKVPDAFTLPLPAPVGRRALSAFQFLFNSQAYLDRMAIRVTDLQRLLLLQDLAGLMGRLHELGVAVGDLSANNLLFSLDPRPACFFIDCDAMRLRGRSVLPQVETAGWHVPQPKTEELGTPQSDRYKFALLALRLFLGEQEGTDTGELARVDPALAQLATRGQSGDRDQRPAMGEWAAALEQAIARNPQGRPPRTVPAAPRPATPPAGHAATGARAAAGATVPPQRVPPRATGGPGGTAPPKKSRAGATLAFVLGVVLLLFGPPHLWAHLAHATAGSGSTTSAGTDGSTLSGDGGGGGSSTGGSSGSGGTSSDGSSGSGGSGGSDGSAEQAEATAVDQLLQKNAHTRAAVGAAVASVMKCESLSDSAGLFSQAASSRRELLDELGGLDVSDVTGGSDAVGSLNTAWTASAEADDHFQAWAEGLESDGCDPNSTAHAPGFQEAQDASGRATAAKQAFVAAWNPIADRSGLTDYTWDAV
ncbi:hypothetical protein SAMN05216267_1005116 [Actinacidiphila rubida]|uniref:Protein kinase domain-containing protein n=1 Tax=Actinacidiphila rubida TaxID=310780 RepID=A0A1H8GII0_9ACTN|nr:hypothetical protein [Actinacidiphila rubida]SEN43816.1 hypothetical protein SAMN05216267_1005116 [Actinacidiphila rubida]